jgi:hypothetical protein
MLKAMIRTTQVRIGVAALVLAGALPAFADTQFRLRRTNRDDIPLGMGQIDVRLQVDGEVEVVVRGDMVRIRTITGRDAYDDGNSECNASLPDRDLQDFNFEVKDKRNEIRLIAEPSRRNNYSAVVMIRDSSGGQGRYHFRLTWRQTGGDFRPGDRRPGGLNDRPGGPPGFAWNNVVSFRGNGRGTAEVNGFERRLTRVNVDIDRGGRIIVTFPADRSVVAFNGTVTGREGNRLRADVVSEDRRLRGPMFISIDNRDNVNSITLEATDGRERMRLSWDRR